MPVLAPGHTLKTRHREDQRHRPAAEDAARWFFGFAVGFLLLQGLLLAITMLLFKGVGVWGINIPVGWGFDIINFVWWIGIGHAGTLISAILFLFRQQWRMSINRAAEAMTLFAVACALLYPLFHTGRPVAGGLLAAAVPEHDGRVAAVPQPAHLGRVRGLDLRARCRRCSGSPGSFPTWRRCAIARRARSRRRSTAFLSLGLARVGRALAPLRDGLHAAGRASRRRWCCRCTRSCSFDFAVSLLPGLARDALPALLRRRRHLLRLRDGADAADPAARHLRAEGPHHRRATST